MQSRKAGDRSIKMNVHDINDRLIDIASELKVIIAAIKDLHPWSTEGYGLYLMLNRHINEINAIKTELVPPLGDG